MNLVNPEAYNDDMKAMVEAAKSKGVELGFFVGAGKMKFFGGEDLVNGIKVSETKILVQYDHRISPQQIYLHEYGHAKWNTAEMQAVKDTILNDLTEDEKNKILSQDRYQHYMEIYKGDKNKVWEEFVVDTLSGMNDYSVNYVDTVIDYMAENSVAEGYNDSTYAESIDAGGQRFSSTDNKVYSEWVSKTLNDSDMAVLESALNEITYVKRAHYQRGKNGAYIIATSDKLIYTDGNYDNPSVYKIIKFNSEYETEIDEMRRLIYEAEKGKSELKMALQIIEDAFGNGSANVITGANNGANERPERTGQRTNSKKTDTARSKASRKREYNQRLREASRKGLKEIQKVIKDKRYSLATDGIPDLEDLWDLYIETYGTIPKGEKPARDIDVPKKISEKKVVSQFARTMLEAGVTPDWAVSEFEQAIVDGEMTHEVVHNKKAHGKAIQKIKKLGFEEALNYWSNKVKTNEAIDEVDFAMGLELYNQCVTNKDTHNAMKLAAELTAEATRSARNLQLCRLLKTMTPDGQLYYLEKSIEKMNEEFKEQLGDKFKDIELDEGLMEEFFNAESEEQRDEVYDRICQHIADQIPATKLEKWDSWRYLAMLGNPRTHMRNFVGNLVFAGAVKIKNYVAATIEEGLEKGGKIDSSDRTKPFGMSKEALEFATSDSDKKEVERMLQGQNAKYATTSDIEGKRTIFKNKWLEWARRGNFNALEKADMLFLKRHYRGALARLITARNIDVNSIDTATLNKIRAIAIKEAQKATFRDTNAIAEALSGIIRRMKYSTSKTQKVAGMVLEGISPFVKTPMNIAKQSIYYSPAGLAVGVYDVYQKRKGADITVADIVDDFSKGLTGTGALLVGYILTSLGILVGGDDEDKKKSQFDELVGEQSYALKFGEHTYTIDWMIPSSITIFVGHELHKLTRDGFKAADVVNAMSKLTEPLLELSVFSGWGQAVKSAGYTDMSPLVAIPMNAVINYVTQGLPTIGGQVSRLLDPQKREYYYRDKTSDVPVLLQGLIGQASSKIPFASYLFTPAVDAWGREEKYGGFGERLLENTVSPGYYSKTNYTKVDKEIKRIYDATGNNEVLPVTPKTYFTYDDVYYSLSADEYSEMTRIRGQKSFELIDELMSNKKYVNVQDKQTKKYRIKKYSEMTDDEKSRKIKACYSDAGEYAKEQMIEKWKKDGKIKESK